MNILQRSATNFAAVRDGRTSPDFFFDVPLDVAGEQFVSIAGNSFYIDANPMDGNAVVYFQDTNLDNTPTPFYVSPGFIARIPFTQVRIKWSSQPGKKIRIVYGTDTDFQPGSVSQVSFAGNVNVNGAVYNASVVLNALTVGAATQVIAPAANTSGIILSNLCLSYLANTNGQATILAKASAPATMLDGDGVGVAQISEGSVNNAFTFNLINPLFLSPGKGLYVFVAAGSVLGGSPLTTATWQQ